MDHTASSFATLPQVLQAHATSDRAAQAAFTWLNDGETVSGTLSYAQLDQRARRIAAALQAVTRPGDRVLLVMPPCLDYIEAFYGCVYAGVIAVPAVSPSNTRTLPRLHAIAADAGAQLALTRSDALGPIERLLAQVPQDGPSAALRRLRWLAVDSLDAPAEAWQPPAPAGDSLVFLQYTSGSTGTPKGVMVSHANLLANVAQSRLRYGVQPGDTFVSWLPPHHDFGLIGAIILPIACGAHSVQFPPAAFLMRPLRWLKLLSERRARITGAPNFAYALCAERITEAEKQALDLSALDVAVNGAERIRPQTLRRFAEAFRACGLRPQALTPSYGMAESVLFVASCSGADGGSDDGLPHGLRLAKAALAAGRAEPVAAGEDGLEAVATGVVPGGGHHLAIADPDACRPLQDRRIGEVWIHGPSVARGYWQREAESAAAFRATLVEPPAGVPGDGWLRSGDLGFLSEGRLYITGRRKELMIFNGRNLYPQDVEMTVEQLDPAFRADGCAVFALDSLEDGDSTQLVVVQEVEARRQPALDTLVARLRAELAERHEILDLAAVLLVRPGRVPRTSSGKLERLRCRQLYLAGDIDTVWSWRAADEAVPAEGPRAPQTDTERHLMDLWAGAVGRAPAGVTENFFQAGGHSLQAAQLMAGVQVGFGVELPLRTLFASPTVQALAREIDAARAAGGGVPREAPPQPGAAAAEQARGGHLPLSFAQRRFWFLDQFQPGNPFYAIPLALALEGEVHTPSLRDALDALVARHETLRTVFPVVDGVPRQHILPASPVALAEAGFAAQADLATRVREAIEHEARQPFDLAQGPLLRATLLRTGSGAQVLLLTLHHVIHDGWSTRLLVDELCALYAASRRGEAVSIAPAPLQYADVAVWEQQRHGGAALAGHLAHWQETLAGAPTQLALPTDRPRTPATGQRGAAWTTQIDASTLQGVAALAASRQATPFMVLAAALQVLLHRLSGQADFCIGVMSANRPAGTEALLGNFVNVLPLRARIVPGQGFGALLSATAAQVLAAHDHPLPFELIRQHVAPRDTAGQAPYTQVVINYHSELGTAPAPQSHPQDGATLKVRGHHGASVTHAAFDLKLELHPGADGTLALRCEYNTDLFDEDSVARFAAHYAQVLQSACADPGAAPGRLNLLTPEEWQALRQGWRASEVAPVHDADLARRVTEQAARTPQATALRHHGQSLSYRQLDERSNRLARVLRSHGVGPDVLVALCVERSLELVVGLLAVLKAGGAYVPLDPAYPPARLAYMLEDSAAPVLLAQRHLTDRLPPCEATLLLLDDMDDALAAHPASALPLLAGPQHLAYMIYTSGSTGRPKGAMVHRQGMLNLLDWYLTQFGFNDRDKVLLFSSFSFDLTQKNLLAPLLVGGELHIPDEGYDPAAAVATIEREGITSINCAPSAFYPLLADGGAARLHSLRQVFLGGEPINTRTLHQAFAGCTAVPQVHNTYGPTEASDVVSFFSWNPREPRSSLPIGQPIANTRLYVLDAGRQPVPQGVVGELFIGGVGVGRGYHRREELTAERFLPDPFSERPQARMYRSGDLVRQLPDGQLDYLGRIDHQVKLRGMRIELGEIEERLAALPGVGQSVVLALPGVDGDALLAAYVVATAPDAEPQALRTALARELPGHMVPGAIVMLPAMPLTPNGKIDRTALPRPEPLASSTRFAAPRTPTEQALAGIWSALLDRPEIGREDDFFALGGHSLLATRVVARIRAELGLELPVRALFDQPTLASLAARLDSLQATDATVDAGPRADAAAARQPEPPSFAEQRLWFLEQLAESREDSRAVYHLPSATWLDGPLDRDILQRCLDQLVQRHDALRTSFASIDGQPLRRVAAQAALPLAFVDLVDTADPESVAVQQAHARALQAFDLQVAPLMRATLWRVAAGRHLLLLDLHHVISDGWSMGVLYRDLARLHAAFTRGEASPLASLPVSYADHARWQHRRAAEGRFAAQRAHWLERLAGAPTQLHLPTDRPRGPRPGQRGAVLRFEVPTDLAASLKARAQSAGATLFMGLAATYGLLLSRHAGQDELLIGTPVANRQHAAADDLVGFFVNTLVLRLQLAGRDDFDALLGHVREVTLEAYAHQDHPFDQLVAELDRGRRSPGTPLIQAMLALQSAPRHVPALGGGLRATPLDIDTGTAKFDLTLDVTDTGGPLACRFEYSTELFDAASIERLAQGFIALLRQAEAQPQAPLAAFDAMSSEQRVGLLDVLGSGRTLDGAQALLHTAFEQWAARQPDAPALIGPGDAAPTSYARLDAQANALAHALVAAGVRPDDRVAVLVDRGPDLALAFLAVLKAGGAYLPCDPAYPPERLAHMLRDSRPAARITQQRHQPSLHALDPAGRDTPTFVLDAAAPFAPQADPPVVPDLHPRHGAYVIYTSGSTGQPKGVLVEHAGIHNLALDQNEALAVGPGARVLQFASLSFDASVWEMVMALTSGAALVLADREQLLAGRPLLDTLRQQQVTHTLLPPSVLAAMQDEPALQPITLLSGGEACPPAVARHWGARHRLVNAYGPTEISVCATTCVYDPADDGLLPIGRPVANTRLCLLDAAGRLVPPGAVGEIHIGGAGVARGYLNLPQLTAERFRRDPFVDGPDDARLYRTGDLGRWLPDGRLAYLGRNDHQVKLRGFRIELPEIEARLRACEGIVDATVVLRSDPGRDARLVAYLIATAETAPDAEALRAALRSHLPEHMLPSAFVTLPAWPLTPNGKLDRDALPAPSAERDASTLQPPQGEVETGLAAIWHELLGEPAVGRSDNFFELGGHSLALTRLSFRIQEVFGVNAGIALLYELQTLDRMAAHIAEVRRRTAGARTRTVVLDLD